MQNERSIGSAYGDRLGEAIDILERYFAKRNKNGIGPGLAVALTDRESLLGEFAYGHTDAVARTPVTTDTLFQIGSITKSIVAAAVMRLVERGRIDLDAPVTNYLDWFEVQSDDEPITVHHLLTHTAGIVSMIDTVPASKYTAWMLRETKTLFPPGERFHYSNVGYGALGYVLENAAGIPLADVLRTEIVEPLQMGDGTIAVTHDLYDRMARGHRNGPADDRPPAPQSALFPVQWFEFISGCGSFSCAARDLAAFLRMLLNRGRAAEGAFLSPHSFERMTSDDHMKTPFEEEYVFGYGLFAGNPTRYDRHRIVKMGGENLGYEAAMIGDLDDGVGVVIFVNSFNVPEQETDFAFRVLQALSRGDAFPEPPSPQDETWEPENYTGVYRSDDAEIECIAQGGKLFIRSDEVRIETSRLWRDSFQVPHPRFGLDLLRFVREDGAVTEAIWGGSWFRGACYTGPTRFDVPADWTTYVGHYRAFAPLLSNFRVVARKGRLLVIWAGGFAETVLIDDGGGHFHTSPPSFGMEHARFDCIADGKAQRCVLGGGTYVRVDTP
jgi:D-alanyl-D-alanine carboxypeptidase